LKIFAGTLLLFLLGLFSFESGGMVLSENNDSIDIEQPNIAKKHVPAKATMFSAVLPGLGQVYNRKYWKLPIVYGGFAALGYQLFQKNTSYLTAKKAYFDLNDNNPNTRSYETSFPENDYTDNTLNSQYSQNFLTEMENQRRQRELYIFFTLGFYLLNVLDANVDAHFIDFDISEDLTFKFEPFFFDNISNSPILGANIRITF
jgi:hypothetical protein